MDFLEIRSFNMKMLPNTIKMGWVFTNNVELVMDVYWMDVIQVAKCSARNTPLMMDNIRDLESIDRISSLLFLSTTGISKNVLKARRYVAMISEGADESFTNIAPKDTNNTPSSTMIFVFNSNPPCIPFSL